MHKPGQQAPEPAENPVLAPFNRLLEHHIAVLGLADKAIKEQADRANLDPLTGIGNRRALDKAYEELQGRENHRRAGDIAEMASDNAIIMFDLDHFKAVNDRLGHVEGDGVLKGVAGIIDKRLKRRDDVAVRFGGEEFTALLPDTGIEHALVIAEDIRAAAEADGGVTLSAGVSEIDLSAPLGINLSQADAALYHAKEYGRNQVVMYEPGMKPAPNPEAA